MRVILILILVMLAALCAADENSVNSGLPSLDRATERRLIATTLEDLGEVIELIETAQREGLTGDYAAFADDLLAGTSLQRGVALGASLLEVLKRLPAFPDGWDEQRQRALTDLRRALKTKPHNPRGWLVRAELESLPDGNDDDVTQSLEQVIKYASNEPEIHALALLLKAKRADDISVQGELIKAAEARAPGAIPAILEAKVKWLAASDKWDEAVDTVKELLEVAPSDDLKVIDLAIMVFTAHGRYNDALAVIDVMATRLPNNPAVPLVKVKVFIAKGDLAAAIDLLNTLRRQHPDDPRFLLIRAEVFLLQKEYAKAIKDCDAALRIKSDFAEAMLLKYRILLRQDEFEAANSVLDELDKLLGDSLALTLERASLFGVWKRHRSALKIVDAILAITPDNVAALQIKGQAHIALGEHTLARETLDRVVELDNTLPVACNNLAWLLATSPEDDVRDGARALKLATHAAELTEYKEAFILSTLAAAYAEMGDFDSAMKWITSCLQRAVEAGDDRIDDMQKERISYEKKEPYRERVVEEEE